MGRGREEQSGLLVEASPSERAEEVLRRIVETREVNGALLLEADPSWAEAIDTVLEEEGIRSEQLRCAGREDSCRRMSPLLLQIEPVFLADRKA